MLTSSDPLFPNSATLPLGEPGGVQYPVTHTPGALRPYAATLAVPPPVEAKAHDTSSTRNTTSQATQRSDDGQVVPDSLSDTTVDS